MNHRNAFRISLPSFFNIWNGAGNLTNKDHHEFELRPVIRKSESGNTFELSYDDQTTDKIVIEMPESLTQDASLSDGDWVIAGARLLADNDQYPFVAEMKHAFLLDVIRYVVTLQVRNINYESL